MGEHRVADLVLELVEGHILRHRSGPRRKCCFTRLSRALKQLGTDDGMTRGVVADADGSEVLPTRTILSQSEWPFGSGPSDSFIIRDVSTAFLPPTSDPRELAWIVSAAAFPFVCTFFCWHWAAAGHVASATPVSSCT